VILAGILNIFWAQMFPLCDTFGELSENAGPAEFFPPNMLRTMAVLLSP
jgi:hypothetical protein